MKNTLTNIKNFLILLLILSFTFTMYRGITILAEKPQDAKVISTSVENGINIIVIKYTAMDVVDTLQSDKINSLDTYKVNEIIKSTFTKDYEKQFFNFIFVSLTLLGLTYLVHVLIFILKNKD